mmetsp:Transcript_57004/g.112320  ORF Transcript_57004/g.112320 Transcript_57004/m.112320 type:complete len:116 (-) Transcript_57004:179-526(-)
MLQMGMVMVMSFSPEIPRQEWNSSHLRRGMLILCPRKVDRTYLFFSSNFLFPLPSLCTYVSITKGWKHQRKRKNNGNNSARNKNNAQEKKNRNWREKWVCWAYFETSGNIWAVHE